MKIVILSPFIGFSHKLMRTCLPFISHCWIFHNFRVLIRLQHKILGEKRKTLPKLIAYADRAFLFIFQFGCILSLWEEVLTGLRNCVICCHKGFYRKLLFFLPQQQSLGLGCLYCYIILFERVLVWLPNKQPSVIINCML